MKYQTTLKAVRNHYNKVIKIGYCDAANLLAYHKPDAYNAGVYGWNCDIYDFNDVAICTGYRPTGNIRPSYETVRKYDDKARKIVNDWSFDFDTKYRILNSMICDFIEEVTK